MRRHRFARFARPAGLSVLSLEDRTVPAGGPADPAGVVVGLRVGGPDAPAAVRSEPVPAGQTAAEAVAGWAHTPGVTFAEPEQVYSPALIPNDPYFGQQYAQHNTGQSGGVVDADMDAAEAWDGYTGSARSVVAVIDTGVDYTHPDLFKNIWLNQAEIPAAVRAALVDTDADGRITFWDLNAAGNIGPGKVTDLNLNGRIDAGDVLRPAAQGGWMDGTDAGANGYVDDLVGWDFVSNDNDPMDLTTAGGGHGTHVAGTIAAMGNNGLGVAGVAWKASVMPLRFLGPTGGTSYAAAQAITYSANNGAGVSNNSWGGGGYSTAVYSAIQTARTRGQVFVAAAGNSSRNTDLTANYPSGYALDNVVAVAATDRADALASYSNYGAASVDLAAGGTAVVSTYAGGGYATLSGTSMASPQVAGAFTLLRGKEPGLTPAQAIARVYGAVDKVGGLTGKVATGGRLNAARALAVLPPADVAGPAVTELVPNATGLNPVSAVRLTFSEAIDPLTFTAADVAVTGPTGAAVAVAAVTPVAGTANKFDVTFPAQAGAGTYTVAVGPDVRDLAGNRMDQDRDGANGEATQDRYLGTFAVAAQTPTVNGANTTPVALIDGGTRWSNIVFTRDVPIARLSVGLTLTHPRTSDLTIRLVAPGGQSVVLVGRRGTGANMTALVLDDTAPAGLAGVANPFTGTYRPDVALSAFANRSALGTWQLMVADYTAGHVGTLLNWSITITPTNGSGAAENDPDGPLGDFDPLGGETPTDLITEEQAAADAVAFAAALPPAAVAVPSAAEAGPAARPVALPPAALALPPAADADAAFWGVPLPDAGRADETDPLTAAKLAV